MSSVYQRNKNESRTYLEDNNQRRVQSPNSQFRSNPSDSPHKTEGLHTQTQPSNNPSKVTNIKGKINEIIHMSSAENQQAKSQFQNVVKAERGILDLLYSDGPEEGNRPISGLGHTNGSQAYVNINRVQGNNSKAYENKPFLQIGGRSPSHQNLHPTYNPQNNDNNRRGEQRGGINDEAIQMIEEIERKALLQIESLRREKVDLLNKLNQQIRNHNLERQRRIWLQNQLQRLIAYFAQQGFNIGGVQYPPWYNQNPNQIQPQYDQYYQTQTNPVFPNQNQANYPNTYHQPIRPLSPNQSRHPHDGSQKSPSFASQAHQTSEQIYQQPTTQVYPSNYPIGYSQHHRNYQPRQQPQLQHNIYQQVPQYPNTHQSNHFVNLGTFKPTSLQADGGEFDYIPGYSAIQHRPQIPIVQSYDQRNGKPYIAGQNQPYVGYAGQAYGIDERQQENNGYQPTQTYNKKSQLRPQNYNPEDDPAYLQERLEEAERKGQLYRREVDKWRSQAQKGAEYPGILQLLQEGEKIRQQTLKLIKTKDKSYQEYNKSWQQRDNEWKSKGDNSKNSKSNKRITDKTSFQTNVQSPKSNQYESILDEMKRVGRN